MLSPDVSQTPSCPIGIDASAPSRATQLLLENSPLMTRGMLERFDYLALASRSRISPLRVRDGGVSFRGCWNVFQTNGCRSAVERNAFVIFTLTGGSAAEESSIAHS